MGIGGFLLYLTFKDTGLQEFLPELLNARYEYIILSMIMGYLAFVSRGIRWIYLLEPIGEKARTWSAIHAVTIGYFMNMLVPRAGELARCTALYRTDKIPIDKLFGTVILERIIDFIMLSIMVLLTAIFEYDILDGFFDSAFQNDTGGESDMTLKIALAVIAIGLFVALYIFRQRFAKFALYKKVKGFWNGFKEGLKSLSKLEHKWRFIAHTLFIWLMYYSMVYVAVFAFDDTSHISMSQGLFVMVAGGLGMVVPTPGGIGSYHYLVNLSLTIIGVQYLYFPVFVHLGQMVMTTLAGIVAFVLVSRIRKRNSAIEEAGKAD